jgi:hypothetical protein
MARTKTTTTAAHAVKPRKLSLAKKTLRDLDTHRAQGVKGGKVNLNPSGG